MKTSVITVKVDETTKHRARAVAQRFGIPLSTLINAYLHELAETGVVHFSLEPPAEPMTPKMEEIIEQANKEIATGETTGPFDSYEKFVEHLDSL